MIDINGLPSEEKTKTPQINKTRNNNGQKHAHTWKVQRDK
jgi:hypothetical protein